MSRLKTEYENFSKMLDEIALAEKEKNFQQKKQLERNQADVIERVFKSSYKPHEKAAIALVVHGDFPCDFASDHGATCLQRRLRATLGALSVSDEQCAAWWLHRHHSQSRRNGRAAICTRHGCWIGRPAFCHRW